MSNADAASIHQALGNSNTDGKGSYFIPCNLEVDLAFVFGGVPYTISPLDYIGAVQPDGTCESKISGSGTDPTSWTIGTGFLRNVRPSRFVLISERFTAYLIPATIKSRSPL
jgi:hypothetical protein